MKRYAEIPIKIDCSFEVYLRIFYIISEAFLYQILSIFPFPLDNTANK